MTEWSKEHTPFVCQCWRTGCMFCDGGLFACNVCNSFEGATTTHCPGVDMYAEYGDRVYKGEIDFRDGEWREGECSESSPAHRRRWQERNSPFDVKQCDQIASHLGHDWQDGVLDEGGQFWYCRGLS